MMTGITSSWKSGRTKIAFLQRISSSIVANWKTRARKNNFGRIRRGFPWFGNDVGGNVSEILFYILIIKIFVFLQYSFSFVMTEIDHEDDQVWHNIITYIIYSIDHEDDPVWHKIITYIIYGKHHEDDPVWYKIITYIIYCIATPSIIIMTVTFYIMYKIHKMLPFTADSMRITVVVAWVMPMTTLLHIYVVLLLHILGKLSVMEKYLFKRVLYKKFLYAVI